MMKSKINVYIYVCLLLLSLTKISNALEPTYEDNSFNKEIITQKIDVNKEILSFSSYINILSEKLPELRKNKLNIDRSANTFYAASAVDDFSIDGDFKYTHKDQYSALSPNQTNDVDGYTANMALNRTISKSGSRVATGIEYSDSSNETISNGERYYSPSTYVQLTQPILKNAFGIVDRFAKNDAKMQLAIDEIQREENDEKDLNYYKKLYFDWMTYYQRLNYLNTIISNSEKLLKETQEKFNSGLNDNDDLQEVITSLLGYQEQYRRDKIVFDTINSELNIFFDSTQYLPDSNEFNNYFTKSTSNNYDAIPFADTRNSRIYALLNEKLKYSKKIYKNKLLPELNLVGKYNFKATENDFSDSFNNLNDEEYYIGFNVSIPLENTEAKSELKGILLDIDEINDNYDISKNAYLKSLGAIHSSVNGKRQLFQIKEKTMEALESKYETENEKYNHGRLELRFLIETENNIVSQHIAILSLKNEIIALDFDYTDLTN